MVSLSSEQIESLAEKMLTGIITPEEQAQLNEWASQAPGESLSWDTEDADEVALRNRLLARIRETVGIGQEEAPVYRMPWIRRAGWAAAAAVLILVAGGVYMLLHNKTGRGALVANAVPAKPIGAPGGNKATLTLSTGQQLVLDSAMQDTVLIDGNAVVASGAGRLAYNAGKGAASVATEMVYNTLSTARGGQYQLTLPDGTKVWLNAASSIRYPTAFNANDRKVTVTGEAYFEVRDNPHLPFTVTAGSTDITVLGTHFDVMAYNDESHLRTILVEGAVRVKEQDQQALLHPGEEASINMITRHLRVRKADTEEAIAWVNGKLSLESEDLRTLMRQISRWYDVDIRYEGTPPNVQLFGTINRNVNLSDVLTALGRYGIRTRLEGNTVVVAAR